MSKTIIIAEKPSVAQDIVRALTPTVGKFEKHAEHFENDTHVVTSAVGHLVEIKAPDEYEVKRIFDSGVAELLFPQDIYFLNHQAVRNNMIRLFRKQIEESWRWNENGSG